MNRRGMTILELVIAGALLGTLLIVSLKMIGAVGDWRREADRRQLALFEVANLMERVAARPWSELTPEADDDVRLSDNIRQRLPGAELKIEVSDSPPERKPTSKRIAVSIRWRDRAGRMLPLVSITTWRFLGGEEKREEREEKREEGGKPHNVGVDAASTQ